MHSLLDKLLGVVVWTKTPGGPTPRVGNVILCKKKRSSVSKLVEEGTSLTYTNAGTESGTLAYVGGGVYSI